MRKAMTIGLGLALALSLLGCAKKQTVKQSPDLSPDPGAKAEQPVIPEANPEAKIEFRTVYFDFDSYDVRDADRQFLMESAKVMRANGRLVVRLEGHCDERGTVEYNLALGDKRASAVREYLVGAGVDAKQLRTVSYGKEKPAARGSSEEAWAKNRRVELVVELR
jgi:peptidoglycan-associated lipoprotein